MKMLLLILFGLIFVSTKVSAQEYSADTIKIKTSTEFIDLMADSLNGIESTGVLPQWLFNPNLDYVFVIHYYSFHNLASTRKSILDQVTYEKSLELALESQNPKLDATADTTNPIVNRIVFPMPYSSFSSRELLRYRLDELRNSK